MVRARLRCHVKTLGNSHTPSRTVIRGLQAKWSAVIYSWVGGHRFGVAMATRHALNSSDHSFPAEKFCKFRVEFR